MIRLLPTARDPLPATVLLTIAFAALCAFRITIPTGFYFDEIHYIPAARALLAGTKWLNAEHPPLGKEILALGLTGFGDRPLGWRIMPLAFGTLAFFAFTRAMWFATMRRAATVMFAVLLATGFMLYVQSRIAMLDIFMVGFCAVAFWQFAAAVRLPRGGRRRLAACGVALGAAIGCKWNAAPLAIVPGLFFLVLHWRAARRPAFLRRDLAPVPGVSLVEAAVWLGVVPALVYAATFLPALGFANGPFHGRTIFGIQSWMVDLQESVKKHHPYQSTWRDWVINRRAIWYLYKATDGAQRGILMVGNPLTMLIGLPAAAWCGYAGIFRRRWDALAIFTLYAIATGFWIVAAKPVQFFYHYLIPSVFLLAALALALDALWQAGGRWRRGAVVVALAGSVGLFAWFFPILSAAPLPGRNAFLTYTWLDSWR